ncbi:MAG: hypothetical protein AAGJ40_10420 [Planctomycetota bacterium]
MLRSLIGVAAVVVIVGLVIASRQADASASAVACPCGSCEVGCTCCTDSSVSCGDCQCDACVCDACVSASGADGDACCADGGCCELDSDAVGEHVDAAEEPAVAATE